MKMKTGPMLKGKAVAPGGYRTANHPDVSTQKLRGTAVPPTQGRTRNQPATTGGSGMKAKVGSPTPNSYFANSRTPVHPKFDKHPHD